jgi:hypothetical protein
VLTSALFGAWTESADAPAVVLIGTTYSDQYLDFKNKKRKRQMKC